MPEKWLLVFLIVGCTSLIFFICFPIDFYLFRRRKRLARERNRTPFYRAVRTARAAQVHAHVCYDVEAKPSTASDVTNVSVPGKPGRFRRLMSVFRRKKREGLLEEVRSQHSEVIATTAQSEASETATTSTASVSSDGASNTEYVNGASDFNRDGTQREGSRLLTDQSMAHEYTRSEKSVTLGEEKGLFSHERRNLNYGAFQAIDAVTHNYTNPLEHDGTANSVDIGIINVMEATVKMANHTQGEMEDTDAVFCDLETRSDITMNPTLVNNISKGTKHCNDYSKHTPENKRNMLKSKSLDTSTDEFSCSNSRNKIFLRHGNEFLKPPPENKRNIFKSKSLDISTEEIACTHSKNRILRHGNEYLKPPPENKRNMFKSKSLDTSTEEVTYAKPKRKMWSHSLKDRDRNACRDNACKLTKHPVQRLYTLPVLPNADQMLSVSGQQPRGLFLYGRKRNVVTPTDETGNLAKDDSRLRQLHECAHIKRRTASSSSVPDDSTAVGNGGVKRNKYGHLSLRESSSANSLLALSKQAQHYVEVAGPKDSGSPWQSPENFILQDESHY